MAFPKDLMYHKFRAYGFLKNLRFFDPFLILFFREMGLSFLEIGILFSIREISTNILEIPTGIVADAYGRRRSMLASFSAYLISFALFYLFPHFGVYALAMVFFAFGEAFRSGTHKALILEYLRLKGIVEQKVEYYGHTRAASQFGSAIAALVAAGLVFYAGSYRIVFLASIIPYLLAILLMLSYPKELDGVRMKSTGHWLRRMIEQFHLTLSASLQMLRERSLVRGLVNSATFDAVFKSTKDYLQPVLQAQAIALPIILSLGGDQRVALIVGALYFVIYLGTTYAASQAGRIHRHMGQMERAADIIYVLSAILLLGAGIGMSTKIYSVSIVCFLSLFMLQNARRPILVGYLADLIPHHTMATGLSVESQLRTLFMAGLAPLVGYAADRLGIGMALMIVAFLTLIVFPVIRVSRTETSSH